MENSKEIKLDALKHTLKKLEDSSIYTCIAIKHYYESLKTNNIFPHFITSNDFVEQNIPEYYEILIDFKKENEIKDSLWSEYGLTSLAYDPDHSHLSKKNCRMIHNHRKTLIKEAIKIITNKK